MKRDWLLLFFLLVKSANLFSQSLPVKKGNTDNPGGPVGKGGSDASIHSLSEVVAVSPFSATAKTPLTTARLSAQEMRAQNYGQEPSLLLARTPSVSFYTDAGSGSGYSYFNGSR